MLWEVDMRISVRGWGRDLGKTNLLSANLRDAETLSQGERYYKGKLYKKVLDPEDRRRTRVRISSGTEMRLGGSYLLELELTRDEIADLFFETHGGSVTRMMRAFIEEEHREEYTRSVTRMAELRQERLAAETNADA
jgi:hypothetical protein